MVYNYSKFDGMADSSSENPDAGMMTDNLAKENGSVWEHPWSTEEIRKNSCNWTLAGDVGLLNHLKEFSHKLISRTHEMENAIDSLVHTSKVTCAKVNNVINDFQMLSNLQFVENRVYDEEAKSPEPEPVSEPPKTKEQREAEMMPRIKQALELGMSVLDTAFERLDVEETSESEDEEDLSQGRTILVPKDLYEHRPLPYIIGSEQFQRDDYAGLHSLYDEDLSTDVSTQDENISASAESEDESEDEESDFDEQDVQKRPTIIAEHKETKTSIDTLQNRFSDSEGSDLFNAEEDEKEVNGYDSDHTPVEKPKENVQTSLMEELMRKAKGPAATSPDSNKPETIQTSVPAKTVETQDSGDLFASSDSFFDDDDSPFRKKTGLFSSDGLFGKETKSESSLFDDDSDEVKPVAVKKEPEPKVVEKKQVLPKKEPPVSKRSKSPSLFEEDEDSEHDLFSSLPTAAPLATKTSSKPAPPKGENLNRVLPPLPVQTQKIENNKPLPASVKTTKSDSLFGDDSDDNDLFSSAPKSSNKTFDFGSLDDKEDEDDLFSTKPSSRTQKQVASKPKTTPSKSEKESYPSLFEESDSFDLFKPSSAKSEPKSQDKSDVLDVGNKMQQGMQPSLFEESDSFDLFKPTVEKPQPRVEKPQPSVEKPQPSVEKPKFHDKEESKPQATVPLLKEKKETSLFEESDSFDLFSGSKKVASEIKPIVKEPQLKATSSATVATKVTVNNMPSVPTDDGAPLGFDEPVTHSNTLSVINKDRVKIQAKRRKPTRKGRQSHISTDVASEDDKPVQNQSEGDSDICIPPTPLKKEANVIPEIPSEQQQISKPQPAFNKSEQSKKNLMSQLISEAAASKIGRKPALDLDDDDDLFSVKKPALKRMSDDFSLVSPSSSSEILVKDSIESDGTKGGESSILSGSTSDDDLFSGPAFNDFRSSVSDRNSIFDDDDIFKPLKNKEGGRRSAENISIDDDDDDIFVGVDKEKYEMFPTQQYDDDDDDDIFSNVQKPSQPKLPQETKGPSKKESKKENVDLFSDPLGGLTLND